VAVQSPDEYSYPTNLAAVHKCARGKCHAIATDLGSVTARPPSSSRTQRYRSGGRRAPGTGDASFHDAVTVIRIPSGVRTNTRVETPVSVSPGAGTPM
jgi:hypothetical protein